MCAQPSASWFLKFSVILPCGTGGGMVDAARQHDVNFITFMGGILRPPNGFGGQANVPCDLAGAECQDGLMIGSPVMGGIPDPIRDRGILPTCAPWYTRYATRWA
jgi:hypothetical protein